MCVGGGLGLPPSLKRGRAALRVPHLPVLPQLLRQALQVRERLRAQQRPEKRCIRRRSAALDEGRLLQPRLPDPFNREVLVRQDLQAPPHQQDGREARRITKVLLPRNGGRQPRTAQAAQPIGAGSFNADMHHLYWSGVVALVGKQLGAQHSKINCIDQGIQTSVIAPVMQRMATRR